MFQKNNKSNQNTNTINNQQTLDLPLDIQSDDIKNIDANTYVNDLFLDLNRSNFLYYSSQYIDNLMIYFGYIKEYIAKGLNNRTLHRKSLNLHLIEEEK